MEKWANKARGLRFYIEGKDVYQRDYHVQDGSWAMFRGVRIYGHDSANEPKEICLSLDEEGAKKLIKGLELFLSERTGQ